MAILVARIGQRVTISVERQLVGADLEELQRVVSEQLMQDAAEFVVDFAGADYIDSRALGGLVAASNKIRRQRASLRLTNVSGDLRRLFELTQLDALFDLGPGGGPHAA